MSDDNLHNIEFTGGDSFFGQMKAGGVADQQFIREIVQMFIEEGQLTLSLLGQGVLEKNIPNIRLYTHKLKSSFIMFDMIKEHELVTQLEKSETDNLKDSPALFTELEISCKVNFTKLKKKYLDA